MADKKRIVWIDQLRGLIFYFVVLGHMAVSGDFEAWIHSFIMPLYFIISGFNINFEKMQRTSFRDFFSHVATRMLVPYLWLQLISLGLKYAICNGVLNVPQYLLGIIVGNNFIVPAPSNPLYFVVLLFLAQVLLFLLVKLFKGNKGLVFAASLALTAIPVLTDKQPAVWHLNVVPTALIFLFIGRFFMDCYILYAKQLRRIKLPFYIGICVVLLALGAALGIGNGRASLHANGFGDEYMMFVISACITSIAFSLLAMLLPSTKLFSFIGMNTFFILGVHEPIMVIAQKLFPEVWEKWWFVVIASVICYFIPVPFAWLFSKVAPYTCAKAAKESNLLIKISKFVLIALVLLAPYLDLTKKAFGGALSSGGGMTVLAGVIFILAVVGLERLFTLVLPFFFIESKQKSKVESKREYKPENKPEIRYESKPEIRYEKKAEPAKKPDAYEDDDVAVVVPVEEE